MQNKTPTELTLVLTPKQAATALAISQRKLWGLTASGEIPHFRIGRSVRYSAESLRNWILDNEETQSKGS